MVVVVVGVGRGRLERWRRNREKACIVRVRMVAQRKEIRMPKGWMRADTDRKKMAGLKEPRTTPRRSLPEAWALWKW